jgi:tetraacyldisaccharide-1-P 4'-kinase
MPHAFADHAPYSAEVLNFTPSLPLVMTEKDAVKCRAFAARLVVPGGRCRAVAGLRPGSTPS